jgi:hypothetical protein
MDDYVGKPYRLENLQRLLYRWLGSLMVKQDMQFPMGGNDSLNSALPANDSSLNHKSIHDLRNALGGVIGGVELALMSPADSVESEEQLNLALEAARRAVVIASKLE